MVVETPREKKAAMHAEMPPLQEQEHVYVEERVSINRKAMQSEEEPCLSSVAMDKPSFTVKWRLYRAS